MANKAVEKEIENLKSRGKNLFALQNPAIAAAQKMYNKVQNMLKSSEVKSSEKSLKKIPKTAGNMVATGSVNNGNRRSLTLSSAPNSIGGISTFGQTKAQGRPSPNSWIGKCEGVRVVGSDLMKNAVAGNGQNLAFTASSSIPISPNGVSTRLVQYEELYQFYAFRRIVFTYTPDVNSGTSGSVALGVDSSSDSGPFAAVTTQQQVLQYLPNLKVPLWGEASMLWEFNGSELWTTGQIGATSTPLSIQFGIQANLVGLFNTSQTGTFGTIMVDYVIDFYKETPIQGNPSIALPHCLFYLCNRKVSLKMLYDYIEKLKNEIHLLKPSSPIDLEFLSPSLNPVVSNNNSSLVQNTRSDYVIINKSGYFAESK